jgi:peptidoglycan/xylan/chitin deacetylase (PgdA/CDA1 family)
MTTHHAMPVTRRGFFATAAAATALLRAPTEGRAAEGRPARRHLVTLSFDDGFRKSFLRTAEIYEKHGLAACFNVVADGMPGDAYIRQSPLGDFGLWNELQKRGHEVMPHGYRHENLRQLPLEEAKTLIRRCLDVFTEKLEGFGAQRAIFNFPYNASTSDLEQWLPTQVRAFRTGGAAINPLPHAGQVKLTCTSFGPGNCETAIDREIDRLFARESGWLIFNTHGLDDEGWGPIRAEYLEHLLQRLAAIESVEILPAGKALQKYAA